MFYDDVACSVFLLNVFSLTVEIEYVNRLLFLIRHLIIVFLCNECSAAYASVVPIQIALKTYVRIGLLEVWNLETHFSADSEPRLLGSCCY